MGSQRVGLDLLTQQPPPMAYHRILNIVPSAIKHDLVYFHASYIH